jgi:hypothetical protein
MLVALEIHEANLLLVTATDPARGATTKVVAAAGLLTNLDQALLRLGLRDVTEVRDRNVSRGRR